MVHSAPPTSSLTLPSTMFAQDIIDSRESIPELEDPTRIPILQIHARGTSVLGSPHIVTRRTEAYITGWEDRDKAPPIE